MSVLHLPGVKPEVILFDWHATLVDTMEAMYNAVDDVLPKLAELNLLHRLVKQRDSKSSDDAKLVNYVRIHGRLHPQIKAANKISRTDIFQVLFGDDEYARKIIHQEFDHAYRNHIGEVHPLEDGIPEMLTELRAIGLKLGVLSNRSREYLLRELEIVDDPSWASMFDCLACGTDVERRKPAPDLIFKALSDMGLQANISCWYVGDSTTDVIAANDAGVTSIFYNGAGWDKRWLDRIFPGTMEHPHVPDAIIDNFSELIDLIRIYYGARTPV